MIFNEYWWDHSNYSLKCSLIVTIQCYKIAKLFILFNKEIKVLKSVLSQEFFWFITMIPRTLAWWRRHFLWSRTEWEGWEEWRWQLMQRWRWRNCARLQRSRSATVVKGRQLGGVLMTGRHRLQGTGLKGTAQSHLLAHFPCKSYTC